MYTELKAHKCPIWKKVKQDRQKYWAIIGPYSQGGGSTGGDRMAKSTSPLNFNLYLVVVAKFWNSSSKFWKIHIVVHMFWKLGSATLPNWKLKIVKPPPPLLY